MTCTCEGTAKGRGDIDILSAKGETLASFKKSCPAHGIEVVDEKFYVLEPAQFWFTRAQMAQSVVFLRRQIGLRVVEVSADQSRGVLEYLVWVPALVPEDVET